MIHVTTWATPDYRDDCEGVLRESLRRLTDVQPDVLVLPHWEPPALRAPTWRKICVLQEALKLENAWSVWIDADSVVVNPNFQVASWLDSYPAAVNCVLMQDWNGPCCGFIALRNCDWSRSFLDAAWFTGTLYHYSQFEQGYVNFFMRETTEHTNRFAVAPTTIIADTALPSQPYHFVYHIGSRNTRWLQRCVLEGKQIGGLPHGIHYAQ